MVEREPQRIGRKLAEALRQDYPEVESITFASPTEWKLVERTAHRGWPLYVVGSHIAKVRPGHYRFPHLLPEANEKLVRSRRYQLLQPYDKAIDEAYWAQVTKQGLVDRFKKRRVELVAIGQARVWKGAGLGIIWDCYLHTREPRGNLGLLRTLWKAVERDMPVTTIFTPPHEPTFPHLYPLFLTGLGYGPWPIDEWWWWKGL
jgi:hypothetical protein